MAFRFQDLAVTISTSFEDHGGKNGPEPKAVVAVVGCGPQSVVAQYGTCAASTQRECTTNPADLKLENAFTNLGKSDLDVLRQVLKDLLGELDPALGELSSLGGVVHNRPCLQPPPPPANERASEGEPDKAV